MPQALPANPNLDWLRKAAKRRHTELCTGEPGARLHQAQLALARDYGFTSWRAFKAYVDAITPAQGVRDHAFAAARAGDTEALRRALRRASILRRGTATAGRFTRSPRNCGTRP